MPIPLGVDVFANPGFFVTYAAVQGVVLLVLVRLLDPFERLSIGLLVLMALWGATGAAFIALIGNEAVKGLLSGDARIVFGDVVSAPVVEELAKGLALVAVLAVSMWLAKRSSLLALRGVSAWMACGAAVGLGFSFTEDFFYFIDRTSLQGIEAGADLFLGRRDFFGPTALHHPLFTAAIGAGIGLATWSRSALGRIGFPLLGLAVAILMHAVNNGLVELIIVIDHGLEAAAAWVNGTAATPEVQTTADVSTAALVVLDYVWLAAFLGAIFFWQRYQRRVIRTELQPEVAGGVMDPEDLEAICTPLARPRLYWRLIRRGDLTRMRRIRDLHGEEGRLGLLKWQTDRFGGDRLAVLEQRRRVVAAASIAESAGTLPHPSTSLIGREQDLQTLTDTLRSIAGRVLTLTGPGGVGKTRLALELAAETERDFPGGAWFVDLSPVTDPADAWAAIADELGLPEAPGELRLDRICDHLRDRRLLLVLDNFEQVAEAGAGVERIARSARRVGILVTSRTALRIAGETEHAVTPLPTETPESGGPAPAVRLFLERARAATPGFDPAGPDLDAVGDICRRLDGLPLALELAAARTGTLSPRAILKRIAQQAELPGAPRPDLPDRQRSLSAAVAWSEELLDDPSRVLLHRISVFPVGCRVDGAAAVYEEAAGEDALLELLGRLREASLLIQRPDPDGEPRFLMLATIRGHARESLGERGEAAEAETAAARYLLDLATGEGEALSGPGSELAVTRLDQEYENLRAALGWLEAHEGPDRAVDLAAALGPFWERGHVVATATWIGGLLARNDDRLGATQRAQADALAGRLALLSGDYERAQQRLAAALDSAYLPEPSRIRVTWDAGWNDLFRGRYDEADRRFSDALERSRASGDPALTGQSRANLGRVRLEQGRMGEARELLASSLSDRRSAGDARGTASSLSNLARLDLSEGRLEEAERNAEEALALARRQGDDLRVAEALHPLAVLATEREQGARAGQLAVERLRVCEALGDRLGVAESLEVLSASRIDESPGESAEMLGAAAALRESMGATTWASDRTRLSALESRLADSLGGHYEAARARGRAVPAAEAAGLAQRS